MRTNRLWIIGSVLAIVAIIAGSFLLGVQPLLAAATKADVDRANVMAQNQAQEATLATLKEQFKGIDKIEKEVKDLRVVIPDGHAQDRLIQKLADMGTESGIFIRDTTFSEPVTFLPPESLDASYPDPAVTAATTSLTSGNFLVIPVVISAECAEYEPLMVFIDKVQHSDRLFLAYDFGILLDEVDGVPTWKLTISGHIYVLTDAASAVAPPVTENEDGTVTE